MIVTTVASPDAETQLRAACFARELAAPYVPRGRSTVAGLMKRCGAHGALVVGPDGLRCFETGEPPLFFHPSMALVRLKRLLRGGGDALLDVSGAGPGDAVLDCTGGLGSDAIVLSHAVGPRGSVVSVEKSPLLHLIVREGLRAFDTGIEPANEAMRRIRAVRADHGDYLRALPDRSVDIVYFDPMFRRPVLSSSALRPLRSQAEERPLSEAAVREAVRVARRRVVLKDHRDSGEFERLGFVRRRVSSSKVAYGVIDIDDA